MPQAAYFQVRLTLVSEPVYHVQYFTVKLINVEGLACLFNVYFLLYVTAFNIIIVKFLILATA